MGAVYKAEHLALAQTVAIKVLLTATANDPSMVKRFIREARTCFKIDHPNCVRVTDFGAAVDGSLYFAMEYLDGRTLGIDLHIDGAMSSARVRHVGAQVADALHHAHGLGLIHRDLKPGNIMLVQRDGDHDFVKVFDFGLGKLVDEGAQLTGLTMSPLTQHGIVFGTPEYMSPEQAKGQPLGPASDIYTLGVCCYEMLTNSVPFDGKIFTEILRKHVTEAPERPSTRCPSANIDPELEALVMACLHKDPEQRPLANDLAIALRRQGAQEQPLAPSLASSETILLSEQTLAALPQEEHGEPTLEVPKRSYLPPVIVASAVALLILFYAIRDRSENASQPFDAAPEIAKVAQATHAVTPSATVDAGEVLGDATVPEVVIPDAAPKNNETITHRTTPDVHLQAAEQARRDGKLLKQLSEANASLKQHPGNRRAAFLAGDALLKSGDKVAACTFFKRAGKRHYRAAGCSN